MKEAVLFTPMGGVDWDWFGWHRRIRETRWEEGVCVDCGDHPATGNKVVCEDCAGRSHKSHLKICAWCGGKRKVNAGIGGPTYPVWLRQCEKPRCDDAPIPDTIPRGVGAIRVNGEFSYEVELATRLYVISLSGTSHWAAWTKEDKFSVALTGYCETPWHALQVLVESLDAKNPQSQDLGQALEPEASSGAGIEDLTDQLVDAMARWKSHGLERTRAALAAGAVLVEVQAVLGHGHFGEYLETHGLKYRTVRNWMDLHQVGLSAEEVQELGGIKKALASLSRPPDAKSATGADLADYEDPVPGKPHVEMDSGTDLPEVPDDGHDPSEQTAFVEDSAPRLQLAAGPSKGTRHCELCKNTPRRGADLCRPCEVRTAVGADSRLGRLIKENARLRKSVKGLKWQLYGNTRPALEVTPPSSSEQVDPRACSSCGLVSICLLYTSPSPRDS